MRGSLKAGRLGQEGGSEEEPEAGGQGGIEDGGSGAGGVEGKEEMGRGACPLCPSRCSHSQRGPQRPEEGAALAGI